MSKPSRISISEEELEKIKKKEIYLVIERELQQQAENRQIKNKRAYPSFLESLLNDEESKLKEKKLLETGTIDDGDGMFWMDIIALLVSEKTNLLLTRSDELHKKLSEEQILQWFQTLRSSIFLLNSMLLYSQKVSDVSAKGLEQQTRIEQLQTLNSKLMKQESEALEHVMDLHNWAGIDEVKFASNFKI